MRPGDQFTDPGTPWIGLTAFCLGSGDSLRRITARQWLELVHLQRAGRAIIFAVNSSVKTARINGCEPDALFFTDTNWWEDNETLIREFPGRVFSVCRKAKAEAPEKIERIENIHQPEFRVGIPPMRDGRSSGHRAVSLSVMLGAARVVMLGYDMRVDPVTKRSHCHDDYQHPEMDRTFLDEFVPSFTGWHASALKVGCEIVNATPGSMVKEFPIVDLDEVLGMARV